MEPRDIFISHVAEDGPTARALAKELAAQHLSTWTYEDDGVPGVSHLYQSSAAIESCRAFLLLASPQSVRAHQVIREVEEAHEARKVIIPVRLELTHEEFIAPNRILRMACGTAVSIAVEDGHLREVARRVVVALAFAESQMNRRRTHEASATLSEVAVPTDSDVFNLPQETRAQAGVPLRDVVTDRRTVVPGGRLQDRRTSVWPVWIGIVGIVGQIVWGLTVSEELYRELYKALEGKTRPSSTDYLPFLWLCVPATMVVCSVTLVWPFVKVLRSQTVSRSDSRNVTALFAICLVCVLLIYTLVPHHHSYNYPEPTTALFDSVNVELFLFNCACLVVVWLGMRAWRRASRADLGVN
jgi:TIR domain